MERGKAPEKSKVLNFTPDVALYFSVWGCWLFINIINFIIIIKILFLLNTYIHEEKEIEILFVKHSKIWIHEDPL